MAGTVHIFGHAFKTWQVGAVTVGGAAAAWYVVKRQKAAAAAAAAAASSADPSATDPLTGLPYADDNQTDPITGESYLAEAQQYGSVSAAEAAFTSGDTASGLAYSSIGAGSGTSYGVTGDYTQSLGYTSGGGYASNADWDQAATAGLTSIGYTETDVASALGRYLAGLSLTPDQQNIVNVALAEFGNPPSGALPVIAAAGATATSGSTGTGTTGTGGSTGTTQAAAPKVSGGHVVSVTNNDAVVAWTGTGATSWQVKITGPGAINGKTSTVTKPQASYSGLEAGHDYTVTVTPIVGGKLVTSAAGSINIKTP